MRIIGIDPGYDRLGIAIIEKPAKTGSSRGQKETVLFSECLQTSAKDTIYVRLKEIGQEIGRVLDEYKPDELAIETLFIENNQKTVMRVSEARGIIIYEAVVRDIAVFEYTPLQVKMSVTGNGKSDKGHIFKMLGLLVKMPGDPKERKDDEYDAIAVALTHSASRRA